MAPEATEDCEEAGCVRTSGSGKRGATVADDGDLSAGVEVDEVCKGGVGETGGDDVDSSTGACEGGCAAGAATLGVLEVMVIDFSFLSCASLFTMNWLPRITVSYPASLESPSDSSGSASSESLGEAVLRSLVGLGTCGSL